MMLMVSITIFLMLLSITRVFFLKSGAKLLPQTDTRSQSYQKKCKKCDFFMEMGRFAGCFKIMTR